jgi:hypothetical protein
MSASGTIGKAITFAVWKGIAYVRKWFKPSNPQSADQVAQRLIFSQGVLGWQDYDAAGKLAWDADANRPAQMSGFNYHMRCYINAMLDGETPPIAPP